MERQKGHSTKKALSRFFTGEIRRALRRQGSNLDRLSVRNEPVDMRLTDSASQTYLRPMSGKGQPLRVLGKQDA